MFIPLAEQTSMISEIGQLVIQQTAKQIRKWNDQGFHNICISVNIVAQQLRRGQLLDDLDEAIKLNCISGSNLELEITESSLVENSETVMNVLNQIKERASWACSGKISGSGLAKAKMIGSLAIFLTMS
jgi:EAL domain-containing protein (putative c-di-GMP-specific phosphodiesterase class I)